MKILNFIESIKIISTYFVFLYMWLASCLYLIEKGFSVANWLFYMGLIMIACYLLTSPKAKKFIWKQSE